MADLREVFPILQDDTTGAGEAPISRIEGEAAAGKEGLIGFSFKDASGNVVLPQLTSGGAVVVDTEAHAGICLYDNGENASGSLSDVDICTITASLTKVYDRFEVVASCLRTSLWRLYHINDVGGMPTETLLSEYVTGPGAFNICCMLECLKHDTTGGTGVQNFVLRAKNMTHASCLRGTLAIRERA